MTAMFQSCFELIYLDLSNFDTSNVTSIRYMFGECHKLKEVKGIKTFNTVKVTKIDAMFKLCNELEYLDLSNFDTSNINF